MSRDGSGNYNLPVAAFVFDTVISETDMNSDLSDIAAALTASLCIDGQTLPTADLPMGAFKHTGVGNASARNNYAAAGQIQDDSLVWCGTAGGTKNALTLTPSPAITTYATGARFRFKSGASPSDDVVTIAISGLTTKAAQVNDAAMSSTNVIDASKYYEALYDGTALQLTRLSGSAAANPVSAASTFGTDNSIIRADGTTRGVQSSGATATIDDSGNQTLASTDAGATVGPLLTLDRNSASPAVSDVMGGIAFTGRDSGAGTDTYAQIQAEITDPTAASEDGILNFLTKIAGTAASRMKLGAGLILGAATGGDQGAGTINATDLLVNGVSVSGATGQVAPYVGRTAPSGWLLCNGTTVSRATYAALYAIMCPSLGTVTVTIATPGVFTLTAHGLNVGEKVRFTTSGALPTGLTANTDYFVSVVGSSSTFQVSASLNGASVNTSGSQSGTHTGQFFAYGAGDGSTTFTLPDFRGRAPFGSDTMGTTAASRVTRAVSVIDGAAMGGAGGDQNIPAHGHPFNYNTTASGATPYPSNSVGGPDSLNAMNSATNANSGTLATGTVVGNAGTGTGANMPPAIITNFIVKT